jgi:hypothetical protein
VGPVSSKKVILFLRHLVSCFLLWVIFLRAKIVNFFPVFSYLGEPHELSIPSFILKVRYCCCCSRLFSVKEEVVEPSGTAEGVS